MLSTYSLKKFLLILIPGIILLNGLSNADDSLSVRDSQDRLETDIISDSLVDSQSVSQLPDSVNTLPIEGLSVPVKPGVSSKNPTLTAIRSLLIPGWGQAYTGHWFKAVAYFGADAGMIYGAVVQHGRYKDNLDKSKRQKTVAQRLEYEDIANFYRDDRNRLIWWAAGVTLLATFDAFVEAHLYDFDINPSLGVTPEGDGPSAGITITFP